MFTVFVFYCCCSVVVLLLFCCCSICCSVVVRLLFCCCSAVLLAEVAASGQQFEHLHGLLEPGVLEQARTKIIRKTNKKKDN